ncbi:cytochrome P450 2K3-like isoform X2 [Leucoraja erinacea]|uniref:cytochrome P450 2K3-like isoform X2 n=1 Tax=Leucoraja erinaceus TaxID=7782 RepID=UPI00245445E8|nr:cytochrome P450 2K3-like isoform X2 [Leucoraja erinacea]
MMLGSAFPLDAATLLILGALSLLLLLYFRRGCKCHGALNLPPGPPCLPIIGHLHLLDLKKPHESLMELSEKYGPIFSIKLGTMKAVVLTGYETVKDALINHPDEFGGRGRIPIFDVTAKGHGIVFGHGESWKQMRRFTMSTLRDFGMGKKSIEDKIIEETHFLVKMFESYEGDLKKVDLRTALHWIKCTPTSRTLTELSPGHPWDNPITSHCFYCLHTNPSSARPNLQ